MQPRLVLLLASALLLAGCTGESPTNDRDGDHADDDQEVEGKVITVATLDGPVRRTVTSDPDVADTDADGLLDGDEYLRGTDPRDVDTDDDGLLDGDDVAPRDEDVASAWRAAGVLEVNGTFLGELDACPEGGFQLRPSAASSDLPLPDQLLDGEELRGWDIEVRGQVRHVTSNPCAPDTDEDGLADHEEKQRLTDPRDADTDGDGTRDGADADPLWNLGLEFSDLQVDAANATGVRVLFSVGVESESLAWPGNASARLDVPDQASPTGELAVNVILSAEETATGRQVALFDDPRGAIVSFDLLEGTVSGATAEGGTLRFSGEDGEMSLRWTTSRR